MKAEDLLLSPELSADKIHEFLRAYGFKDPAAVDRNLQLIAEEPPSRHILARMMNNVLEAARLAPDPDAAINYFERLMANVGHRSNFLRFLSETPEALEALLLICGASPFNAEILIRNPEYFYWLLDAAGPSFDQVPGTLPTRSPASDEQVRSRHTSTAEPLPALSAANCCASERAIY